jgi:hypothetical protein
LRALQHCEQNASSINLTTNSDEIPLAAFAADGTRALLASLLAAPAGSFSNAPAADYPEPLSPPRPSPALLDWSLSENTELDTSPEARAVAQIAEQLSQYFNMDPASDDELEEHSDNETDREPTVTGMGAV